MFNAFSLGVNRIIDLDAVDYKVVPGFSYNPRINTAFVWLGTAAIRGRPLDQEVKTNKKWPWLIATAIHCKLRMVLHTNYVKSSVGSRGGGSLIFRPNWGLKGRKNFWRQLLKIMTIILTLYLRVLLFKSLDPSENCHLHVQDQPY